MTKLEILRKAYSGIERVDPEGETYAKICAFLDARTDKELVDLQQADIKWISSLARNRVAKRGLIA